MGPNAFGAVFYIRHDQATAHDWEVFDAALNSESRYLGLRPAAMYSHRDEWGTYSDGSWMPRTMRMEKEGGQPLLRPLNQPREQNALRGAVQVFMKRCHFTDHINPIEARRERQEILNLAKIYMPLDAARLQWLMNIEIDQRKVFTKVTLSEAKAGRVAKGTGKQAGRWAIPEPDKMTQEEIAIQGQITPTTTENHRSRYWMKKGEVSGERLERHCAAQGFRGRGVDSQLAYR